MLTVLEEPAPSFLPKDIKLTVTEEPAANLLLTDVKSIVASGLQNAVDIKLYTCLAKEAASGSPTTGIALEHLDNMLSPRKKRPTSTPVRDDELRVQQLNLLTALVDRLTTSDRSEWF